MAEIKLPIDPSASTEHLKPNGKHKHRRINRQEQQERYEIAVDASSSELISTDTPKPGDNLEIKQKKVIGIDD